MWGIRGKKAILPMLQQGMIGWGGRVGASGGKGGLTSFNELIATGGATTIQERVGRKRGLSPELDAWNKGVERLKNNIHMHLLPAVKKAGDVIPKVSSALSWMIGHWKELLIIWGSTKILRFFSSFGSAAKGGRSIVSGLGKLFGIGGTAAGGTAAGGASTTTASAGFVSGISSSTAGLIGLTASLAPAIAGLHELGKAYTKEGREEKLKQLRRKRKEDETVVDSINRMFGVIDKSLRAEGMEYTRDKWGGIKEQGGVRREIATRKATGVTRSKTSAIQKAYMSLLGGDITGTREQIYTGGLGKTIKGLGGASEYTLSQLGLNQEMIRVLSGLATVMEKNASMTTDEMKLFISLLKDGIVVNIVDPNKTASGVTDSRRGAQ